MLVAALLLWVVPGSESVVMLESDLARLGIPVSVEEVKLHKDVAWDILLPAEAATRDEVYKDMVGCPDQLTEHYLGAQRLLSR